MKIQNISYQTNCYLVWNEESKEGFVVDCIHAPFIISAAEKLGVKITALLVTHGHYDHIMGAADLKEATGAKIYMHKSDIEKIDDGSKNFSPWGRNTVRHFDVDVCVEDGDELNLCGAKVKAMHTPGHSEGEMCYIMDDVIFCGDVLFKDSYGRYDNYDGDFNKLKNSIERLFALKGDYRLLCGHDVETSLEHERKSNPILFGL